jgi:hypothetical protein
LLQLPRTTIAAINRFKIAADQDHGTGQNGERPNADGAFPAAAQLSIPVRRSVKRRHTSSDPSFEVDTAIDRGGGSSAKQPEISSPKGPLDVGSQGSNSAVGEAGN